MIKEIAAKTLLSSAKRPDPWFGARHFAAANDAHRLEQIFHEQCDRYGIATRMSVYEADAPFQPALL